jgi:lipoxygenase homology domain-containing protein 1
VTGDRRGAGTDANVSIVLYGDDGNSGPPKILQSSSKNFERGIIFFTLSSPLSPLPPLPPLPLLSPLSRPLLTERIIGGTDTFGVECADLGNLTKIRIGHDGKGFGSGWFLEKVYITNPISHVQWVFLCGRWLDKVCK